MALIAKADAKTELGIIDTSNDDYLDILCDAILSIWDEETGRTWESTAHTEYYNMDKSTSILVLDNYPVSSSADFYIYDDPSWDWNASSLINSDDYRINYTDGVVYYDGYFYEGNQSVKVVYTSGYSSSTFPRGLKQILVRQVCFWFQQGKSRTWHIKQESTPAGGGSVTIKTLAEMYLPEFSLAIAMNKSRRVN